MKLSMHDEMMAGVSPYFPASMNDVILFKDIQHSNYNILPTQV
jgi:hypothetical protein